MKILFTGPNYAIHLKRWLKYFSETGWQVYWCGYKSDFVEYSKYINKICLIDANSKKISKIIEYRKIIKSLNPDIINFHYIDYNAIASLFSFRIPVVLSGWGTDFLVAPYQSTLFKYFLRFIGNKSALVTSIAEHMTDILTDYVGISRKKILTSSWGCDTKIFYKNNNVSKPSGKIRVINPRGFEPHYNWKTFLNAIPIIISNNKNYEFVFANTGSEEEVAKEMVKNLKIDNYVKFLGRISPQKISEEYNKSHIYVSLSEYDGNNISLNEAMACGIFPVCSNTPATKQWITHSENGIILNDNYSATELADILSNYHNYNELIKKSKEVNFKIVAEKADMYKNLYYIESQYKKIIEKNIFNSPN